MNDRRISEANPAELIEAAIGLLGWDVGPWTIELVVRDGRIEKTHAKSTAGRHALLERRRRDRDPDPEPA